MSLKIIFAGTPEFAAEILKSLLHSEHSIQTVLTQCDKPKGRGQKVTESPVKVLAEKNQLPILQVKTLKNTDIQQTLRDLNPDLMIVVAYGLILPKEILSIPKYGCINVHASLLPRWRGASPIQHSILAGDPLTGITLMQMDEGLDTGDILAVYPCPIEISETTESLSQRLALIGANLLINTLPLIKKQTLTPQKQEENQACYAPKIKKEEALIDWQNKGEVIDRQIRAFNPWPIAETSIDGTRLRIFKASIREAKLSNAISPPEPGTILEATSEGILVATGKDYLLLTELQLPGGKRLNANALLNSKKEWFYPGKKLGT